MASTIDTRGSEQVLRRHPVRGGLWGLSLGLGLAIYAILFRVIAFGEWLWLGLVVLAGIALGIAWAYLAPARHPTDPRPADALDDQAVVDDHVPAEPAGSGEPDLGDGDDAAG